MSEDSDGKEPPPCPWALEADVAAMTPVSWEATHSWPVHDTQWVLVGMYVVYRSLSQHEVLCINKW